MKSGWWGLAIGIFGGLLASGVILLVSSQPRGEPVRLQPPPSPNPLTIHVAGAVVNPGVYTLAPGTHVQDAILAAGGVLPGSDPHAINLAALLQNGQRIYIPGVGTDTPADQQPASRSGEFPGAADASELININTADQLELETLPGIGPITAQKIIAYRAEHGDFQDIEAIQDVPGIGPGTFEQIKQLICVQDAE